MRAFVVLYACAGAFGRVLVLVLFDVELGAGDVKIVAFFRFFTLDTQHAFLPSGLVFRRRDLGCGKLRRGKKAVSGTNEKRGWLMEGISVKCVNRVSKLLELVDCKRVYNNIAKQSNSYELKLVSNLLVKAVKADIFNLITV